MGRPESSNNRPGGMLGGLDGTTPGGLDGGGRPGGLGGLSPKNAGRLDSLGEGSPGGSMSASASLGKVPKKTSPPSKFSRAGPPFGTLNFV